MAAPTPGEPGFDDVPDHVVGLLDYVAEEPIKNFASFGLELECVFQTVLYLWMPECPSF